MTRKGLADLVRENLKTTSLTDAVLLMYANLELVELARKINKENEDYFGTPAVADLIAGQREYTLPADILENFSGLEIKFKNETGYDYVWINNELDVEREQRPTDEAYIASHFGYNQNNTAIDIYRNSLWIYSGTLTDTVEDGLKLWYFSEPDALPDATNDVIDLSTDPSASGHGLPRTFHELLATGIQIRWKNAQQKPIALSEFEGMYDKKLNEALSRISKRNKGSTFQAKVPLIEAGRPMQSVSNSHNGWNM